MINKQIKIKILTDVSDIIEENYIGDINISLYDLVDHYNDLIYSSDTIFYKNILSSTSKGRLLNIEILSNNITWKDIDIINLKRNYYSNSRF